MSITREFDDAFHAGVARLRGAAAEHSTRVRESRTLGAEAARHVVTVATPLFAAAFARLQSEGFPARRLPTGNKGMFNTATEPVISTIDDTKSWGQQAKMFGPFLQIGMYITSSGRFFITPDVRTMKQEDKDVVPVFNSLVPPKYAQSDPNVRGGMRWYRLEDAVEVQAREIAFQACTVPSLGQATERHLAKKILVDESTGDVHVLWTDYDMPKLDVVPGVGNERMEPIRPGIPFQGRHIESLEAYVQRLVARKIVLSGRGSR
ncbi:hypothetical protein GDN83_09450 [Gordonia jinghuaiqii]|uniref:Uncharacterized protein n=1 Tax=Gordonia jinghuaiqii TaxID=2758710 RepID=A0A7D7QZ05_9ACTN|nr:hypothetical protein [Gordonia jinghuaiqii]MCR5977955.1 hypothetical protein [Gordonia jinghuaiqii]QMT02608.1 hypothetical protein H1R19_05510 [Gordonia jinghuaiqii]